MAEKHLSMYDLDKLFVLVMDDEEMFYIPPITDISLNAIATRNQVLILNVRSMDISYGI